MSNYFLYTTANDYVAVATMFTKVITSDLLQPYWCVLESIFKISLYKAMITKKSILRASI